MPCRELRIGVVAAGVVAFAAGLARGQCPPGCAGGGGPASSDCYLAWANAPGKVISCTDGDGSCDVDGQLDGTCTFGLAACTNVAVGACTATPLDAPPSALQKGTGGEALVSALGQLPTATSGCTESGLVKLAIAPSQKKLKPAKLTLRTTAIAGGKKDKDTFRLVCSPGRPSLATHVQPIFDATCIAAGCHSGQLPQSDLSLEAGQSATALRETALASFPKIPRVKPGSLKKSYLTRSLFGNGAVQMPDGCPNAPVEGVCLTPSQISVILAWIQAGALP
jgi:hypothetical protein